jgi:phosphatidate cytidylyltransferase
MNIKDVNADLEQPLVDFLPKNLRFVGSSNFRRRVISAAFLIPATLAAIYFGGIFYTLGIILFMVLGLREWLLMVHPKICRRSYWFIQIAGTLLIITAHFFPVSYAVMAGIVLLLLTFVLAARDDIDRAPWVTLGIPYLVGTGLALMYLRQSPEGIELLVFLMVVVWSTDIGAYLTGKIVGGPLLIPEISPKKTWAGLCGGTLTAALFGLAFAVLCRAENLAMALFIAFILALVAQLGDLFESYVKRRSGVKDSGDMIPGHGGILDRIDGLLFASSFFVLFQTTIGEQFHWW